MTPDWPAFCLQARTAVVDALSGLTTRAERERSHGIGVGGDETVGVDAVAEAAAIEQVRALHGTGVDVVVVSEELGRVELGSSPDWWLAIDPVDGSKNAKRGLPYSSLSIAVADGPTVGDVVYGYVYDFGTGEEWTASRGAGAALGGAPVRPERSARLETVVLEATRPELLSEALPGLIGACDVVRVLGSLALSLCKLAAGRVDGVCTLRGVRSVDIAAAQLVARELGASVGLAGGGAIDDVPLDLDRHDAVLGAGTEAQLEALRRARS